VPKLSNGKQLEAGTIILGERGLRLRDAVG
jgi:hypothetical protein